MVGEINLPPRLGFSMNKKVFKLLYNLILVIVILFVASLYLTKTSKFKYRAFIVQSGSMEPAIKTGSVVYTKSSDRYKVDDVITFQGISSETEKADSYYTTHRVVETIKDGEQYKTKGDANKGDDLEVIDKNHIIGKVVFFVPYLGYAMSYAWTKIGLIVLVIIPGTIIIYSEILKIKNEVVQIISKRKLYKSKVKVKDLKSMSKITLGLFMLALGMTLFRYDLTKAIFNDEEENKGVISTGTWEPTPEEWDKSSLHFNEEFGCVTSCELIEAKVCNEEGSEEMQGPSSWELYFADSGNPKEGEITTSGAINPLAGGVRQDLSFETEIQGNYMFKAYQRPEHPGPGELWSEDCEVLVCDE